MRRIKIVNHAAVILCVSIGSGCVSTTTHEKMQTEKEKVITELQQEKTTLEQQKTDLQQQKTTLEKDKASLQQQADSLEKQKSSLEEANQQRQAQYEKLAQQMSAEVEKGELKVRQYQNMLSVDVAEQIFFDSGHANIKASGQAVLNKLGEVLKGYDNKVIRVVGHTDNVPLAKTLRAKFPTNWELSVSRATNVVRALQDAGVPPDRMVASGRGEYEPIAPNDSPEGKQKNRRIEIMLIDANLVNEMSKKPE